MTERQERLSDLDLRALENRIHSGSFQFKRWMLKESPRWASTTISRRPT